MKPAALAAGAILLFLAAAAADLGLRSRAALAEAARHEAWVKDPAAKIEYFDGRLAAGLTALEKEAAAGRLSPDAAEARRAGLKAERDFMLSESSAKQAYVWYRTAAEKFRSPLNPWAARAAAKVPAAREAWKAELLSKGLKPEDTQLD